jgi:hypothetical protein
MHKKCALQKCKYNKLNKMKAWYKAAAFKMSSDGEEETACESAPIEFLLTGSLPTLQLCLHQYTICKPVKFLRCPT